MRRLGYFLAIMGAASTAYALMFFDTSVSGGSGLPRINNLGLMNDRQIIVIAAGVTCIIGVMLLLFASSRPKNEQAAYVIAQRFKEDLLSESQEQFVEAILKDNTSLIFNMLQRNEVQANGHLRTGRNYLQYAVRCNSKGAVAILLSKGASASQVDDLGESAQDLAHNVGDAEMCALFPKVGAAPVALVLGSETSAETSAAKSAASRGAVPAPNDLSVAAQFERLAALHQSGSLDETEFRSAKSLVLAQLGRTA